MCSRGAFSKLCAVSLDVDTLSLHNLTRGLEAFKNLYAHAAPNSDVRLVLCISEWRQQRVEAVVQEITLALGLHLSDRRNCIQGTRCFVDVELRVADTVRHGGMHLAVCIPEGVTHVNFHRDGKWLFPLASIDALSLPKSLREIGPRSFDGALSKYIDAVKTMDVCSIGEAAFANNGSVSFHVITEDDFRTGIRTLQSLAWNPEVPVLNDGLMTDSEFHEEIECKWP